MKEKKLKILIADDEEGLRLSMAGILEMEGHEVIAVEDGYKAIEKAKAESFDVAFLDIKMPGITGVDAFKKIKEVSPETLVVMMTAFAVNDLIKEAINEGAYACLSKPFDMDKIIETLKEVSNRPFVLVIDNDENLCDILNEKFKDNGINVVTKRSGLDGIELTKRKIPDVIFLDIGIQSEEGIETLEKLKEMLKDNCPRTIVMGTLDIQGQIDKIKEMGVIDFIKKPLDFENVKQYVYKSSSPNEKLRICIVDSDSAFCESLKKLLSAKGYEVDIAYSGNEIVEKIRKEVFKALILDIKLPDMNGIEVYEKIKELNPEIGVIFISGNASDEKITEKINKNNYNYLHKPIDPDSLINMLEIITRNKNERKA